MPFDIREEQRFNALKGEWVSFDMAEDLLGVNFANGYMIGLLRMWSSQFRHKKKFLYPDKVSIYAIESALQSLNLMSIKNASIKLAMEQESLELLLDKLKEKGYFIDNPIIPNWLVDIDLIKDIHTFFPKYFRPIIFEDRNVYYNTLHSAIKGELCIEIKPIYCYISERLVKENIIEGTISYADNRCCISQRSISLEYRVWLDFNKPLNLEPDICSLELYAKNENILSEFLMGLKPDSWDNLIEKLREW